MIERVSTTTATNVVELVEKWRKSAADILDQKHVSKSEHDTAHTRLEDAEELADVIRQQLAMMDKEFKQYVPPALAAHDAAQPGGEVTDRMIDAAVLAQSACEVADIRSSGKFGQPNTTWYFGGETFTDFQAAKDAQKRVWIRALLKAALACTPPPASQPGEAICPCCHGSGEGDFGGSVDTPPVCSMCKGSGEWTPVVAAMGTEIGVVNAEELSKYMAGHAANVKLIDFDSSGVDGWVKVFLTNGNLTASQPAKQGEGDEQPTFTDPLEALRFLSGRFKHAGVAHIVALSYARDIDALLATHPAQATIKDGAAQAVAGEVDQRISAWQAVWERIYKHSPQFAWKHQTGTDAVLAWIDEHAALTAEIARLRDNDARYRWIRDNKHMEIAACWLVTSDTPYSPQTPEELDTAIDTAIRASRGEGL